jgi:hypothetical protein
MLTKHLERCDPPGSTHNSCMLILESYLFGSMCEPAVGAAGTYSVLQGFQPAGDAPRVKIGLP